MIQLRPYQSTGIAAIREAFGPLRKRAPLYVLPTGGGKTRMFSAIAHAAYHIGYRRGHLLRCKRLRERMAVEVKRVV